MKILWLCNIILPQVSAELGIPSAVSGGWLSLISEKLSEHENTELCVCFPGGSLGDRDFSSGKLLCRAFSGSSLKERFRKIVKDYDPDVIHIFGTELSHTLVMLQVCRDRGLLDKTLVTIQGFAAKCAEAYYADLPGRVVRAYSLRDFLRGNSIKNQRDDFADRGEDETAALKIARNVSGRTAWDEEYVRSLNPDVNYYRCNETLRSPFYEKKWELGNCERHSIFVAQSNYPLKGFHLALKAMTDIVAEYPDAILYTTGQNPLKVGFAQALRQTYYQKYIGKLIKKYKLENNVAFLGRLNAEEMRDRLLRTNVFVCCSSVENSPNSLCEAMILGVPCVSSAVGGISSLAEDKKECLFYKWNRPDKLAAHVKKLFLNEYLAQKLSAAARERAQKTHDPDTNLSTLLSIYNDLEKK